MYSIFTGACFPILQSASFCSSYVSTFWVYHTVNACATVVQRCPTVLLLVFYFNVFLATSGWAVTYSTKKFLSKCVTYQLSLISQVLDRKREDSQWYFNSFKEKLVFQGIACKSQSPHWLTTWLKSKHVTTAHEDALANIQKRWSLQPVLHSTHAYYRY